jgi:hypothetical protein
MRAHAHSAQHTHTFSLSHPLKPYSPRLVALRLSEQVAWPGDAAAGLELTSRMTKTAPVPLGVRTAMYPECPRAPPVEEQAADDLAHFLQVVGSAPVPQVPFPYAYFCDAFHPAFYRDIVAAFPPTSVMEPAWKLPAAEMKVSVGIGVHGSSCLAPTRPVTLTAAFVCGIQRNKSYSSVGSNNHANLRFKMSAYDILAMQPTAKWPTLARAKTVWQRLKNVFFSKEVEALLWERFNLTRKPTFHDFRVQSDHTGYSIGVHPDSPKKILTMMFYVPLSDATVYDFGTCLHTPAQYKSRDLRRNGEAPCARKFKFASNTGYSFPVSEKSFHSVNTVSKRSGVRQTILVNWYAVTPVNAQPKSFKAKGALRRKTGSSSKG